jgi:hypothetical protein
MSRPKDKDIYQIDMIDRQNKKTGQFAIIKNAAFNVETKGS